MDETSQRMNEINTLLNEFNADLHGFNPGVTAYIRDQKPCYIGTAGAGYMGEHLDFSRIEWKWLEPLLIELRDLRKKT